MSRSRRKTPIIGITCCDSEKLDKKLWHGIMRARERVALTNTDWDTVMAPLVHEVSNPWSMGKDGRHWLNLFRKPWLGRYMRK